MGEREKANIKGKVVPFTPRKKPRLKKLDYVDPEQKRLRQLREKQRADRRVRSTVIRNVGIFIVVCLLAYLLKEIF
ncbi:hypothetical protein [Desulforamulus ferrireducens]|uniref:Uncharacterized protein n=1 Tax=Desulforamulus ferrireducens TaxID=1833852 RepID=A0A1S6ITT6_9FIRM|nr:hypothetical protein [Desulforamulus ferrireducens]AQS58197.1 hypothetical protein B0537_03255 [Desulforamulus ferrireducens]